MKKYVLISCLFALVVSCNNDDENNLQSTNGEYLLKSMSRIQAGEQRLFDYNSNNQPISLIFMYNFRTDYLSAEYVYDNDVLIKISIERDLGDNVIENYEFSFTEFNEFGGHANISYTTTGYPSYKPREFDVVFEGKLIKSFKWTDSNGGTLQHFFNHDEIGRLTSIEQINNDLPVPPCFSYFDASYEITEWDDNERPGNLSIFPYINCFFEYYLFPNHYYSTKNPKRILVSEINYVAGTDDIKPTYEYDMYGNTISYLGYYINERTYASYIEAN